MDNFNSNCEERCHRSHSPVVTQEDCDRAAECFDFIDPEEQADAIARVAPIFARHRIAAREKAATIAERYQTNGLRHWGIERPIDKAVKQIAAAIRTDVL